MCAGLAVVALPPSPKVQLYAGDPLVLLVKLTVRGAQPVVVVALKAATGAGFTATAITVSSTHPPVLTDSVTL